MNTMDDIVDVMNVSFTRWSPYKEHVGVLLVCGWVILIQLSFFMFVYISIFSQAHFACVLCINVI